MARGFYTQGVCLLTNGQTTLGDIQSALRSDRIEIVRETPPSEDWCFGGPGVIVPLRPDVNGYALVDVVDRPWPDSMGDPKSDASTFGAWSMGFFGPLTFPGGLARARQHAWAWESGRTATEGHKGFVRILTSYVLGTGDNAPVIPQDYDPLEELTFVNRLVLALFKVPGVICYFNPNGEVLKDHAGFHDVWNACGQQGESPLPLWVNIRFFNLNKGLGFMDTIGNGQLEVGDVEAVFPSAQYQPGDIGHYLRNVTHYLLDQRPELKSGEAIDGPGESDLSWTIEVLDEGTITPPRKVVRLYPKSSRPAIQQALAAIGRT
jgi:hypothetical protein